MEFDRTKRLDEQILAAFEQACRLGEMETAEHLLRAIEALGVEGEASLERAYFAIASTPPRPRKPRH